MRRRSWRRAAATWWASRCGHLADPEWCKKAKAGKSETIRKCIGCLVCFDELEHCRHVKCSVNPAMGHEREFANPASDGAGRTVAVVGGGPAGVTAAMVLRERGFRVVLFEPSQRLGGTLNVADKGFAREKITRFVDSMIAQVEESGVELRLGEEATVEKVGALSPCGVFIACGARPLIPLVPGIDGQNVVIAEDVLVGRAEVKGDSVIIGSGMTGLETAEVVMRAGHKTSLVDMLPQIGAGANIIVIMDIKERMACYDPVLLPGHRLLKVTAEGVDLECMESGESVFVAADTVILAMGVRPHREAVDRFKEAFPDARIIGRHGARRADSGCDTGRLRAGVRVRAVGHTRKPSLKGRRHLPRCAQVGSRCRPNLRSRMLQKAGNEHERNEQVPTGTRLSP